MLRSRLAELLAKNNERQDELSEKIGISKTTLSNMVTNRTSGVQYGTLNALAVYFGIEISELFEFLPFDITFVGDDAELDVENDDKKAKSDELGISFASASNVFADITTSDAVRYRFVMGAYLRSAQAKENEIAQGEGYALQSSSDADYYFKFVSDNNALSQYLDQIPRAFKQQVLSDLEAMFLKNIAPKLIEAGLSGAYQIELNEWTLQTKIS